jgi:hypothetical protein
MAGAGPPSMPFPRLALEGVDGGPAPAMTTRGRYPVLDDSIIPRRTLNGETEESAAKNSGMVTHLLVSDKFPRSASSAPRIRRGITEFSTDIFGIILYVYTVDSTS